MPAPEPYIWIPPYRLAEIPGLGDRLAFVNRDGAIVAATRRAELFRAVRGNMPLCETPQHLREIWLGQEQGVIHA
jgi:hypothetical protein